MKSPALSVTEARAGYGSEDVLQGVSFDLHRGEVLGVVGSNGCGKSTLLRALTGLLPLRGGAVRMEGHDLSRLCPRARARLCAVQPQTEAPVFDFDVRRFVLLGRHARRPLLGGPGTADKAATDSALACADLEKLAGRSVRELSAGEWQRALLARALAQETPLLLLDEPVAHRDPGHRLAVLVLWSDLARHQDKAILCVSHDLNLAAEFSDRLMVMQKGMIRALGTPREVLRDELLQEVFGCPSLRSGENPFTGKPGVFFAP
ncbi:MAG: ABC transporter ATP-binding protein [Chthoniobacterales bacterium]